MPSDGLITIKRTRPGSLRVDVSSAMAQSAAVYTHLEREAMAVRLAETVGPGDWQCYHLRVKRGTANRGFVALLSTRQEPED